MEARRPMTFKRPGLHYNDLQPCNLSKLNVESYARKVADAAHYAIGADLKPVVDAFGGRLHYQDLDEWVSESGSIFVHGRRDFDLLLASHTSPLRDRFTIAHELGHYFLHARQGDRPIVANRECTNKRAEWEANWFAAALLMPESDVKSAWNNTADVDYIASRFGVSRAAATVRLRVLDCVK